MNKNKNIAYVLAASLLVGGTFIGTKALFTDRVDVSGELKISTGDVDIEVIEDTKWILDRNGNENAGGTTVEGETGYDDGTNPLDDVFANNIKPGDVLTKVITVKNEGTLIANVKLTKSDQVDLGVLDGFLTLDGTLGNGDTATLKPGDTVDVRLTITADGEGVHNANVGYNTDYIEEETIDLTSTWILEATQKTAADE